MTLKKKKGAGIKSTFLLLFFGAENDRRFNKTTTSNLNGGIDLNELEKLLVPLNYGHLFLIERQQDLNATGACIQQSHRVTHQLVRTRHPCQFPPPKIHIEKREFVPTHALVSLQFRPRLENLASLLETPLSSPKLAHLI